MIDIPLAKAPEYIATAMKWSNDNQGVVSWAIFAVTLFLGWASGIFSALRKRPKLRVRLIEGPTFFCTFPTGSHHEGNPTHRVGIALYPNISNVGTAAAAIDEIAVGYHWALTRSFLSWKWWRYAVGWHWVEHQTPSLTDFQRALGDNRQVFPFLTQRNHLITNDRRTFLQPGEKVNGIVYFEQEDSWGGCQPAVRRDGRVTAQVRITDSFGRHHVSKHPVRAVTLDIARVYNPSFGTTIAVQVGQPLPHDQPPGTARSTGA